MKHSLIVISKILLLSTAALLVACNRSVFVDEFLTDSADITVSEGSASVHFDADNWGILNIIDPLSYPISIVDPDGNMLSLPLQEGELAIISFSDGLHDFRIEKRNTRSLDIIPIENMEDYPFRFTIIVGNKYEWKSVNVGLPPSPKYQLDSVIYDFEAAVYTVNTLKPVSSSVIDNSSSQKPVTFVVRPYAHSFRDVDLLFEDIILAPLFTNLFGETLPTFGIPDIEGDGLAMNGAQASLSTKSQKLGTELDAAFEAEVTVNAGEKKEVIVFNDIEQYSIPFCAYISNPGTGRSRSFRGTLYSELPYNYFILKKTVNEEEQQVVD